MNVTSLRRPANKPRRPAWRAPGPAKVPSWSARPPAQVVRRTTRTTVVQVDDAQLFAEEACRARRRRARRGRAAAAAARAWSPGTPRAASPPPPPFVHQGVVEWSPPRPEDADDDAGRARPGRCRGPRRRPSSQPRQSRPTNNSRRGRPSRSSSRSRPTAATTATTSLRPCPRDSDDASSAAPPPARPNVRDDDGPASPTTMEAVGLLVEHAARLEDEVRRRTGVLEDEVIRLRTEGAAQETAALRGELAELRQAILGAVRRDPEPHDEIERLRDEVAELRASARLPPEDLGDALAAVTRAAVDKVAAVRNQVADRHWVPEDAAAPTGVEQASADRHRAQDDDAAERTGVEQASPAVDEPQPPAEDPWAPLTTADGHVYWYHTETHETTWERPVPPTAPAAAAEELAATARALAARDARIAELEARLEAAAAPVPEPARQPAAAPAPPAGAWAPLTAPTGDVYWYHTETHETTWERPVPVAAPTPAPQPVAYRAGAFARRGARGCAGARVYGGRPRGAARAVLGAPGPRALLDGPDAAAAPPRPDDAKLEGLVGDLIGALKTDAGKRDFERLAAQQAASAERSRSQSQRTTSSGRPPGRRRLRPPPPRRRLRLSTSSSRAARRSSAWSVTRRRRPTRPRAPQSRKHEPRPRPRKRCAPRTRASARRWSAPRRRAKPRTRASARRWKSSGAPRNGRRRATTRRRPPRPRSSPSSRRARGAAARARGGRRRVGRGARRGGCRGGGALRPRVHGHGRRGASRLRGGGGGRAARCRRPRCSRRPRRRRAAPPRPPLHGTCGARVGATRVPVAPGVAQARGADTRTAITITGAGAGAWSPPVGEQFLARGADRLRPPEPAQVAAAVAVARPQHAQERRVVPGGALARRGHGARPAARGRGRVPARRRRPRPAPRGLRVGVDRVVDRQLDRRLLRRAAAVAAVEGARRQRRDATGAGTGAGSSSA